MPQFLGPLPAGNFLAGRAGHTMQFGGARSPSFLVLHTTSGTLGATDLQFKDETTHSSAHYGVGLDGSVVQWLDEADTAFHTGNMSVDLVSIGIQHEDGGRPSGERTDVMYGASSALVRDLCLRYRIPISRQWVIDHRAVPNATTDCPGGLEGDRIVGLASGTWNPTNGATEEAPAPEAAAEPATAPVATEAPAPPPPPPPAVSHHPDPLRDIAAATYHDPERWPDIYAAIEGIVTGSPALMLVRKMVEAQAANAVEAPANGTSEPAPVDTAGPPHASDGDPPGGPPGGPATIQTPSLITQKYWGGGQGAVFIVQIVYLLLLGGLAAVYFNNRAAIGLPETLGPLPVAVPWFGALGAVLISLAGITEHRRDWDESYRFWHWSRPLLGASFGSISVLIFQAGILAVGTLPAGTPGNVPKNLLFYLTAFLVGYREETFRELIKRLSDVIIAPGGSAGGLAVSSMSPQSGTAAGGASVAILGSGLSETDSIRFGTTPAFFHVDGDTQVTVTSPAGQASTTVNVIITTKSASAIAGTFSYT